jgi:hypothetical protein
VRGQRSEKSGERGNDGFHDFPRETIPSLRGA